jgi:hypothetical protein
MCRKYGQYTYEKKQLFNLRVKRQIVGFYKMYFLLRSIRQPLNCTWYRFLCIMFIFKSPKVHIRAYVVNTFMFQLV